MSTIGLEVSDETIQETNIWLKEVMKELGPDRKRAYRATQAVLRPAADADARHLP